MERLTANSGKWRESYRQITEWLAADSGKQSNQALGNVVERPAVFVCLRKVSLDVWDMHFVIFDDLFVCCKLVSICLKSMKYVFGASNLSSL